MPLIAQDDRQAVEFALRAMGRIPTEGPRVVRIKNSLRMDRIYMTRNLLKEASKSPNVTRIGTKEVNIFKGDERKLVSFELLEQMSL